MQTADSHLDRTRLAGKDMAQMATDPCIACGEETAVGSPLYSSRKRLAGPDQHSVFLCDDCRARLAPREVKELNQDEQERLREGGTLFGAWFNATGH